eukprot:15188560-Alexandrium_andersonii.AAC.1
MPEAIVHVPSASSSPSAPSPERPAELQPPHAPPRFQTEAQAHNSAAEAAGGARKQRERAFPRA